MKKIDYSHSGGFPLEQHVLDKMQASYFDALKAFIGYLNIPDAGKYIVFGCDVVLGNITPGMMYIDGDLCTFAGAAGSGVTKIAKATLTTSAAFENGTSIAVFTDTVAQINVAGTALSEFIRFYPVYDQNYVHTDFNFSQAFKDKLTGIQEGAQVNVQPDLNATVGELGYILNVEHLPYVLHSSSKIIGDIISVDTVITINFPDVGTSDYIPVIVPVSLGAAASDNNLTYATKNATPTSFDVIIQEIYTELNNIRIDYILFKKQ